MNKKYRDITVDGIQYAWMVKYTDKIVIFKDKKIIIEERTNVHPITPVVIETLIKNYTCITK